MREKNTSRHHLLAQFHGGTWHYDNIRKINHRVHEAFHIVFSHETIVQQIDHIINLNESAMNPELANDLRKVLSKYRGRQEIHAYNPKCIQPEKFLLSLNL